MLVVGGGPGGLQAAISCARDGHAVTVLERQAEPGGQVRLAASVPNRAELGDMVRNQVTECRRLGVTISSASRRTRRRSGRTPRDLVVVATGAVAARPWWVGGDVTNVCDIRDVLTGAAEPAGDVVLIDEIGFHHATSVAELLADRGCRVEVATPGMVVGQDLGITLDMEQWWIRAGSKGIVQSTDVVPMGFDGTTLTLLHHPTGANLDAHAGLGRARRAGGSGRAAVPRPQGGRRARSCGSATASRRAGPTPPSSRATGWASCSRRARRDRGPRTGELTDGVSDHWWQHAVVYQVYVRSLRRRGR